MMLPAFLRNRLGVLTAIAGGFILLLALQNVFSATSNGVSESRMGQAVWPAYDREQASARQIIISRADEVFHLTREEDSDWRVVENFGFPANRERVSALSEGLANLRWGAARTADPEKLELLHLGAPNESGAGTQIEILDGEGAPLLGLIIGRKAGRLYGRETGSTRTYRLNGDLPHIQTRTDWLDLDILDMQANAIKALRLFDDINASIYFERSAGAGVRGFVPAPPFETAEVLSALAITAPALALARFAPIEVKPAAQLSSPATHRHITTTFDGLELDVHAFEEADGYFVTLRAVEAGEGTLRAQSINERANGWAFQLAEFDWREIAVPVSSLVRFPEPLPEEETVMMGETLPQLLGSGGELDSAQD